MFTPLRLGAPTTVSLGFQISAGAGQVPSPLTGVDFHYPANLGIATSGLGVASCPVAELEAHGPSICPPDSRMGSGSAFVEIPVGGEVLTETASIGLVAGPSENGYVKLLVSATGLSPVAARIVMPSLLLAGNLKLTVPLVESLPEAPDVVGRAGARDARRQPHLLRTPPREDGSVQAEERCVAEALPTGRV